MNGSFCDETRVWQGVKIPWTIPNDLHISEMVMTGLKRDPERIVQISADENKIETAEELRLRIIRVAQNLARIGIKDEDIVSVVCSNTLDLMAYTNGIIQLGAIINPMFVDHSKADLINMFKQTKPKLIICDFEVYDKVREVCNELESVSPVYITAKRVPGALFAEDLFEPTGNEKKYQTQKFNDPNKKIMGILSSSGTSGPAKGVCMSQTFFTKFASVGDSPGLRLLTFAPIFWGSSFSSLIMATMTSETRIVTRKKFTPKTFFDVSTKHRATFWMINPPSLTSLLQSPLIDNFDTSILKTVLVMGGIVSEQLRKRFKEVFPNAVLMIFYGMTEVSCTIAFPGQPIDGLTVGFVFPNHELKVVDDDGKTLMPGEVGELYVKFTICPFLGYYGNPIATKNATDSDGFVKTGDLGYIDEKGFVYVIDRKKDIYKYKGHQITPSEIEDVVSEIKGVELVAVVGISNAETYNLTSAVIQKQKGFDHLTEQEIIDHVASKMPEYKHINGGVYFVEAMPRTINGKIIKNDVKEIATKQFAKRSKI